MTLESRRSVTGRPHVVFDFHSDDAERCKFKQENVPQMIAHDKDSRDSIASRFERKWRQDETYIPVDMELSMEQTDFDISEDPIDPIPLPRQADRRTQATRQDGNACQTPASVIHDIDSLVDRVRRICARRPQNRL